MTTLSRLLEVPLDRALTRQALSLEGKVKSNLFPWNGQFSPELVGLLLDEYGKEVTHVIDPFMGSGTVLIEAGERGIRATGADINPAPHKIARLYELINLQPDERSVVIQEVDSQLHDAFHDDWMVQSPSALSDESAERTILALTQRSSPAAEAMLSALVVLLDLDAHPLSVDRVFSTWKKLKTRCELFPYSRKVIQALNADARLLPLKQCSADLVITSPPYINVFNYHQKYRRSVESLGWDLLHVARSEIGSNRKHRQNRFYTVVQYCIDIADAIREMARVVKSGSRMIIVVGRESNVRKTPFCNSDIVLSVAVQSLGLNVIGRQERSFVNRFGKNIIEDILHFESGCCKLTVHPRDIGESFLRDAKRLAPLESQADLEDAIAHVHAIQPSIVYRPLNSLEV